MVWLWFVVVQLVQLLASLAGLLILIPACVMQAWTPAMFPSINPTTPRKIDAWAWGINTVYGNPEDGVSGRQAIVGGQPYMPTANPAWRAYCWSALRNSAGGLKYFFARPGTGPLVQRTYSVFGKTHQLKIGWQVENGKYNVPVFSLW